MKAIHIRKSSDFKRRSEQPQLQSKESRKWSASLRIKNLPDCFRPARSPKHGEHIRAASNLPSCWRSGNVGVTTSPRSATVSSSAHITSCAHHSPCSAAAGPGCVLELHSTPRAAQSAVAWCCWSVLRLWQLTFHIRSQLSSWNIKQDALKWDHKQWWHLYATSVFLPL